MTLSNAVMAPLLGEVPNKLTLLPCLWRLRTCGMQQRLLLISHPCQTKCWIQCHACVSPGTGPNNT